MLKPTAFVPAAPAFTAPETPAASREPAAHPFAELLRHSRSGSSSTSGRAPSTSAPPSSPAPSVHRDVPTSAPGAPETSRASGLRVLAESRANAAGAERDGPTADSASRSAAATAPTDAAGEAADGTADDASGTDDAQDAAAHGARRTAASNKRPRDAARVDGRGRACAPAAADAGDAAVEAETGPRSNAKHADAGAASVAPNDPALARWLAAAQALRDAAPRDGAASDGDRKTGGAADADGAPLGIGDANSAAPPFARTGSGAARDADRSAGHASGHAVDAEATLRSGAHDAARAALPIDGAEGSRPNAEAPPLPTRVELPFGAAFLAAGAPSPTGNPIEPPRPLDVPLPSAPGAPDFAGTLGLQVSLLARDGVQTAELHLNPADLGPVSVQIAIDGTSARVDFGADLATTRQAIEAGLPELASALREAGLTLSGGGVSEHPRGRDAAPDTDARRRGSAGADAGRGRVDVTGLERTASPRVRSGVPGGVDLYA